MWGLGALRHTDIVANMEGRAERDMGHRERKKLTKCKRERGGQREPRS